MSTGPILVMGKSGQLARSLNDWAVQKNIPMVLAGRPEFNLENAYEVDHIVKTVRPKVIVNTAAYTAVDRAEEEAEQAFSVNRDGAEHLACVAEHKRVPLIHVSTDYVFDGAKQTPYVEDDSTAPLNVYGRSKLEGELGVLAFYPAAIVIRSSWLYGPYGHNFLRTMLRLAQTQSAVKIVDDQRGTPTSSRQLAAGIMRMIERLDSKPSTDVGGIYHLTNQGETTWYGFAVEIFRALSRRGFTVPKLWPIESCDYPTRAHRPHNSCLNSGKIERVFGIRLGPWREAMEACLDELVSARKLQSC
jgi:dTDP-4-dehydrorhamnose reductase